MNTWNCEIEKEEQIMPVFDFSNTPEEKKEFECTYTVFRSDESVASPEKPVMLLDNRSRTWKHHSSGVFTNPSKQTAFEFKEEDGMISADILQIDARFTGLLRWLGENHINVRLSGKNREDGYAVYKIREIAFGGGTKLSAEDGFLQFMIDRLLASSAPLEVIEDEDEDEDGDDMKLTSLQSITDFMTCAGRTMPYNIRLWARRNLAVARSHEVTPEERRHAQRALSIMMNIQWKNNYFESIDPQEARRILDEELYGMEKVKQRIIETIIQINRTHTLPAYGILLVGPAGTGKSQIAYAVARILKFPWTILDMSSINDPEQLTGSSRIYANAKPGIIMESFSMAGESNLVFIINELDKAASGKGNGNPADVLLTLLDNLGFTDNYMECMVPTVGVYPIATANDKSQISAPLMSRFAVIDIPDYTREEKKIIFSRFAMTKVLKRMGLHENECVVTEEALDAVIEKYKDTSGIRDLEQAAEHMAANALYQIEVNHVSEVVFDAEMVGNLLG
jgi:ATP-dependent Lon protease